MAKDGTSRGGARIGAGRKPKSAKISDTPKPRARKVPPVKDFIEWLKSPQCCEVKLCAAEIYAEMMEWLEKIGCEKSVSRQLVEQYAMSAGRWRQCEEMISQYGFISEHPTTGAPCASPYVAMAQNYMKQTNQIWYQIYQAVEKSVAALGNDDDPMEKLLKMQGAG